MDFNEFNYLLLIFSDKPLALYIFTNDEAARNRIIANTSSGGVCVNDTIMHFCGNFRSC